MRKQKHIAAQLLAQQKKEELDRQVKEMNDVWNQFSETLDLDARA